MKSSHIHVPNPPLFAANKAKAESPRLSYPVSSVNGLSLCLAAFFPSKKPQNHRDSILRQVARSPKELLGLLPLKGQTRGEDIANTVIECMDKQHIPLDKIVSILTDGVKIQELRVLQTACARFRSGHLRGMTFVQGVKSFFTYPCSSCSSSGLLRHFQGTVVWRSRPGL
ncbi:hypothetical protein TNCV_4738341 [Trichonephila clavipes]|nr:hypothetical protein TNCV_4738341 [Trichonephila clavipes]